MALVVKNTTYNGEVLDRILTLAATGNELVDKGLMMGADRILVGAQPHAVAFYQKIGFRPVGETYTEAGIEHTVMEIKQNTICKACQGHKEK